jgi:hypothetical protein
MLFSPILSFLSLGLLGLESSTSYFQKILLIYGLFYFFLNWSKLKIPSEIYFLAAYTIYIFIWSFYNGVYEEKGIANNAFRVNVSTLLAIIIIYNTNFSEKFIKESLFIFKITAFVAAIVTIIQVFNYSFLDANPYYMAGTGRMGDTLTGDLYQDRRASIFGFVNPNELGLSYIPLLAVLVGFLIYNKDKSLLFLFLGGVTTFLSNNRYVMIAFIIITFQYYIYERNKLKASIKFTFLLVFLIIVVSQVLLFFGYDFSDWFYKRLFREGGLQYTTRYGALVNFLIFFPKAIFFGTGVHLTAEIARAVAFVGSSQIHVGYLQHLISYGLVGSFLLFGFWFMLAKKLYKTAKVTDYWGSFFAFLVFLWANATLVMYSIFFYGILFALIFDKYFQNKYINSNSKQIIKSDEK